MSDRDLVVSDLWATGVSPGPFPTFFVRSALDGEGVTTAAGLDGCDDRAAVTVAGVVTHRQRPGSAHGVTFVSLEDETGLVNVICSEGVWRKYRHVAGSARAMIVDGRLERADGATNVVACRIRGLDLAGATGARDFR